jgi:outer membrane receptor protein involved in Fe transport
MKRARAALFFLSISALEARTQPEEEVAAPEEATPATDVEQLKTMSLDELLDVVVAATRNPEPVRTAPASVTLIPRSEIDAFSYATLGEALNGVRGLYLTNDAYITRVGVRGMQFPDGFGTRYQIQIDGHSMADGFFLGSSVGNELATDLDFVRSIEVVRGPGSAVYGTGAFLGVVNLVTPDQAPPYALRLGASSVDAGTVRFHAAGGYQAPNNGPGFWISGGGLFVERDFQSDAFKDYPWLAGGVAKGADATAAATVMGKAFWGDFTLAGSFQTRDRRVPFWPFAPGDLRPLAIDRRGFLELRWSPKLGSTVEVFSRAYVDTAWWDVSGYFGAGDLYGFRETANQRWGGLEARVLWRVLPTLKLTAGTQAQFHPHIDLYIAGFDRAGAEVEPPFFDYQGEFYYAAAYTTVDWSLTEALALHFGARADGWAFGTEVESSPWGVFGAVNPRAALVWTPTPEDTVKLMAGRGYRAPNVDDLSRTAAGTELDFTDGVPLKSEDVYTGEVEVRRTLPWHLLAVGSVFVNEIENLILLDELGGAFNSATPVWTAGTEVSLRREAPDGSILATQYSFQRTRVGSLLSDEKRIDSPEHLAALWWYQPLGASGLGMANKAVFEAGRLVALGGESTPPVVLWDATLTWRAGSFDFAVGLRNILDMTWLHVADYEFQSTVQQNRRALHAQIRGTL